MTYLVLSVSVLVFLLGLFLHPEFNKRLFQKNNWLKDLENAAPLVGLVLIVLSALVFLLFIVHIITEIKWFLVVLLAIFSALIGTVFIKERLIDYSPVTKSGLFLKETALRLIEMFNIEENPRMPAFMAIAFALVGFIIAFLF
jgi:hypothetical protein